MEMQTQKTDLWTRRGGESETSGERSMETYSITCKQTASGSFTWRERRGCLCTSVCKQPGGASHGESGVDACAPACVNRQPGGASHGESGMDACAPACVNRQPGGICCMTQGAHTGPLE